MNESHDKLLNNVICNALGFKIDKTTTQQAIQACPLNSFGVFVTIKRQQKLKEWPVDIHGCIGYWDNQFNQLTKQELYKNALRVGKDAATKDNRKNYFKKSLEKDALSLIEIDFMMKPLLIVDIKTGKMSNGQKYNNNDFGLIVQDSHFFDSNTFGR